MKLLKMVLLMIVVLQLSFLAHADSAKIINPANGHQYQRFDRLMSWQQAKVFCESQGGHLATITSPEENNFIYFNLVDDSLVGITMCWLGGTDEGAEGTWRWVTDEKWNYTSWSPNWGEPNNCGGIEHYLTMFTPHDLEGRGSTWNDLGILGSKGCACGPPCKTYDVNLLCEWDIEKKITVTYPNGGEKWIVGSKPTIRWTSIGPINTVKIQISTNNGNNWATIISSVINNGSFTPNNWTVPNEISYKCLIKISETDGYENDISNSVFSVEASLSGKLLVKSPSGQKWDINKIQINSYISMTGPIDLMLEVNKNGTYNSGATLIPKGTYKIKSVLKYYDYITVNNGTPPPIGGKKVRTTFVTGSISIQEGVPLIFDIEYKPAIFLIHGIRSNYKVWDLWVEFLTNMGYIVFTPNHHYRLPETKEDEASEIVEQYFLDVNALFNGPNSDIYLICHSEGGVVARVIVNLYNTLSQKIKKIFTLGTPHSGTDFLGAEFYQLSVDKMCIDFNNIYNNFRNVPVYAISGHGSLIFGNKCAASDDCIVYWNTDTEMNKNLSPFHVIKYLPGKSNDYVKLQTFEGFNTSYINNGHHFCYTHTRLISDGLISILANTIIPNMNTIQASSYTEKYSAKNSDNSTIGSVSSLNSVFKEIFRLNNNSTKEFQINLSSAELVTFHAFSDLGFIRFTLTNPEGIQINSDNYSSYGSVEYSDTDWGLIFSVKNPQPGLWKLEISTENFDDYVAVEILEMGNWSVSGYVDKTVYSPNSTAIFNAEIIGIPSNNTFHVKAIVYDENANEILTTSLYDDGLHKDKSAGDGIFGNTSTVPTQKGYYRIKYQVKGLINGKTVQRESTWGYSVSGNISSYKITVSRSNLHFGASNQIITNSQSFLVNSENVNSIWTVSTNQNWIICSLNAGIGSGIVNVSVDPVGLSEGLHTGTISVTDSNASNSPQTVFVTINVYGSNQVSLPFGEFSTPLDGSSVSSSIPITGWILDNIEVASVKIYRCESNNLEYIGDAIFVEGARPDVEQAYPEYPLSYRAGWGYMMLTNSLPNGGNGQFEIHAIATDSEGNQFTLGTKIITCNNATAFNPFGAIDTPTQGGIASGKNFINWGWALTPRPNKIPINGSTINVIVDGVDLGHPTYNIHRTDIATLFPDYENSDGSAGYFSLDTTRYENGVHTIQWSIKDNAGNSDGIGSRYFTVQNIDISQENAQDLNSINDTRSKKFFYIPQISNIPPNNMGFIRVKLGSLDDTESQIVSMDKSGIYVIKTKELERVVIEFPRESAEIEGYSIVGNNLRCMPIGSSLDIQTGTFNWQPGPGFVGDYRFVFIEKSESMVTTRRSVIVSINPKFAK